MRLKDVFCLAALPLALVGASPAPSVDDLVQRHITALGGIDKIHAIRSVVKYGWYEEGSFHIKTFTAQMRPFYRVIGVNADPRVHPLDSDHEGYDGSAWEYNANPGIVVRTVGQAARAARHTALFDDPLVDYAEHGTTVTFGGEANYHDHSVYVLHVRLADGFDEDYMLDRVTFLLDGRRQVVPMHAFGPRYATDDLIGDYRPEGGVMFAHSYAEVDSTTGKVFDTNGLDSIEINVDMPLGIFSPPTWDRTPLQKMIQRIFDERDDSVAVMATYRDFATLVDLRASATGDAVADVGYECLKAGHTDTATALLTQNVADHPNSARANFELGRAFATAGEKEKARTQFLRALAIDPKYARAQKALDALK